VVGGGGAAGCWSRVFSRQVLREESSGGYDFDPLVAGSTEQRSIAGDDAMGAGPERAREELDVVPVLTGIVSSPTGSTRSACSEIRSSTTATSTCGNFSPIRVAVPRYSARISAETASSNLSSSQAERILAGGPEKKIAETRTFVSSTTLTARAERGEPPPGHPQA